VREDDPAQEYGTHTHREDQREPRYHLLDGVWYQYMSG